MNNVHPFPDLNKVNDEASTWLAKLDRGLSDDERVALGQWISDSEENREVLFKMAQIWDKMDSLSRLQDLFPNVSSQEQTGKRYNLAIAASVLITAFVLFIVYNTQQSVGPKVENDLASVQSDMLPGEFDELYETSIGEYSSATLPDGTTVLLNTNSRIEVSYSRDVRRIVLHRGEAYFDVIEDKDRPLTVRAGNRLIQVLGTVFNVEIRRSDEVELTVTEGKVVVIDTSDSFDESTTSLPLHVSQNMPVVSEGEAAILDSTEITIRKIDAEEIANDLSWQEGNLVFEGETLEEAIHEISRYTSIEFEILDERLKSVRVVGLFKAGDINGLLITLSENFHIPHRRVGAERILLGANE